MEPTKAKAAPAKAKAAPKAAVAPKVAAAPKAAAPAKTAAPVAKPIAGPRVKVTQIGSPIRRAPDQQATLIGLGLNKMNRSRELADTPSTRGMIAKVAHMLKVETIA